MSIQSACIQQWFRFKLLANFDFYLCLRINFHTSSFWVLILAAGGPYWVLISQKNGSLLGPYLKAWGSFLVLEAVKYTKEIGSDSNIFRSKIFHFIYFVTCHSLSFAGEWLGERVMSGVGWLSPAYTWRYTPVSFWFVIKFWFFYVTFLLIQTSSRIVLLCFVFTYSLGLLEYVAPKFSFYLCF